MCQIKTKELKKIILYIFLQIEAKLYHFDMCSEE